MTKFREGKLDTSFVFSKRRLRTLRVDPDAELDRKIENPVDAEPLQDQANEMSGRDSAADIVEKNAKSKKSPARKKPAAKKTVTKPKARKPASKQYVKRRPKK